MRTAGLLLLCGAIGCAKPAPGPELAFHAAGTVPVGEHPVTLAILESAAAGRPLVLVPGFLDADLGVLGVRDGELTADASLPLAAGVRSAVAVDLDENGTPELVLSMPEADLVTALRLGRAGRFEELGRWQVAQAGVLAAGDLDGDGHMDIAVASGSTGQVEILAGDGLGRLAEAGGVAAPLTPLSLRIADLDGDGSAEIAMTGSDPHELWLKSGAEVARSGTGPWPSDVIAAQLDRDPALELVGAVNQGDALFFAELTRNDPGSAGALVLRELPSTGQPAAVQAGDLDRDGNLDLAVAAKGADRVDLFLGDGEGNLAYAMSLATGWGPTALELADLDRDGCLDLVVVNAFSNDVTAYLCTP